MPTPTQQRLNARSRGYSPAWEKAAAGFRAKHPSCLGCAAIGVSTPSTLVDHIRPHRGDRALFWDRENWQSACEWHHNTVKKTLEALWDEGLVAEADLKLDSPRAIAVTRSTPRKQTYGADGWPLDRGG